jgi:site-specific DNA recombinase
MKAILLARVSSKEQEEGQSIPSQVRRLTEYALRKDFQVAETFQITESSTKETRKQFDRIIAYIRGSKQPVALITDTVDRLQRSFRETPMLDEMRKLGKLELHFLREGLVVNRDSNSAQLLQWDIGVLFASSYVRQLSDNVKRSKEQSVRNGEWITKAPFGYKNITLQTGKKTIVVDTENAHFVVKMFEMYATGMHSFQTIANEMNKLGLRNAQNNPIGASRVEFTLKNPFYFGVMQVKGELYPHKYQPLISEALFDQVQDIMAGHNKAPVHYAGHPILFRGLITCEHCGCTVTGDIKKQKYVYYSCNNSKKMCQKIWVREELLLEPLMEYFDRIQLPDAVIDDIVSYLKQSYAHEQEFFKNSQDALRKELDHIQSRLSKLIDMHLDGAIDSETYHLKLEEYKKRQREITSEMQAHVNADETCLITAKAVLDLSKRAKEIFMSSKLSEKQQLLNLVFSNLKLDGNKLLVTLREPFLTLCAMSHQPADLLQCDNLPHKVVLHFLVCRFSYVF